MATVRAQEQARVVLNIAPARVHGPEICTSESQLTFNETLCRNSTDQQPASSNSDTAVYDSTWLQAQIAAEPPTKLHTLS